MSSSVAFRDLAKMASIKVQVLVVQILPVVKINAWCFLKYTLWQEEGSNFTIKLSEKYARKKRNFKNEIVIENLSVLFIRASQDSEDQRVPRVQ